MPSCAVVLCCASGYTAVLSSIQMQWWPWGAPGAEPGADGSTSRAASGTRWLVAASGSAAASEWGAAPAAAASPTILGLSLAQASSGLYAGPTETQVPQLMARLALCPLLGRKCRENEWLVIYWPIICNIAVRSMDQMSAVNCRTKHCSELGDGKNKDSLSKARNLKGERKTKGKESTVFLLWSSETYNHNSFYKQTWDHIRWSEPTGSSCTTNPMAIWHEMLKWSFWLFTKISSFHCLKNK